MQIERSTVIWQRIEGAAVFVAMLLVLILGNVAVFPWWALVLIFFAPDLSFFAYLIGNGAGAFAYNFVHSYGLGLIVLVFGVVVGSAGLMVIGILITGHAGFDRMFGYGLKMPTSFHDTHLGSLRK